MIDGFCGENIKISSGTAGNRYPKLFCEDNGLRLMPFF